MRSPSAPEILDAWERGLPKRPVERGITLLALACPGEGDDALATLPVGDRDRRLLALREAVFGPRLWGLVRCASCGEQLELELGVREVLTPPPLAEAPLVLSGEDHEVLLRLPDSRDLLACAEAEPGEAASVLLRRCVVWARLNDQPVTADALPPALVEAAGRLLGEADPQVDLRFAMTCIVCGHAWQAPFDAAAYLWAEIASWAERMLREVHALASAYGWTEHDILALSPLRRERYLRMLEA
jgi:hypothetical protein